MGSATFIRFVIAIVVVGLLIAAWMIAHEIGVQVGHGLSEINVP